MRPASPLGARVDRALDRFVFARLAVACWLVLLLSAAATWAVVAYPASNDTWYRGIYVDGDQEFAKIDQNPDKQKEWLAKLVEARFKDYETDLESLRNDMKLQLVFVVFALIVLMRSGRAPIKLPIVDLTLPSPWVHFLLPCVLVYLWLSFGYLFDHVIQVRFILWKLLATLERPLTMAEHPAKASIYSYRLLLDDRSFMDAWFVAFHPKETATPELNFVVFHRLFLVLWAAFLGCVQGAAVALAFSPRTHFTTNRALQAAFAFGVALILVGSHLNFLLSGGNPNWFQAPVLLVLLVVAVATWRQPPESIATSAADAKSHAA